MKKLLKRSLSFILTIAFIFTSAYVGLGEAHFSVESKAATDDSLEDMQVVEFDGHCYQVFDESLSWTRAKAKCENLGGHLVTITSQEEQDFITSLLDGKTQNCYWLGATDKNNEGVWKWVTGEKFEYTNWKYDEPNNQGKSEHYLEIYAKTYEKIKVGNWNDIMEDGRNGEKDKPFYSSSSIGFICEWDSYKQFTFPTPKVSTTNEIGGVQVSWNKVSGATKYVVYRRQAGYSTWVNVGTTTGTTLLDKNVKSGIYYCYSVRAYKSSGVYTDFVNAYTQTRKYMAVPKLTGISNATNGLYIKWNAVNGVTNGYRVYRRGAGSTYWTYLGTTKNTYFTDTAVKNKSGEYYRYTVIADGGYHSKFDTTGLYLKRLANPSLTSAVFQSSGVLVKWGVVKGSSGYYVYRKTASSNWERIAIAGGANTTSYLDRSARKGITYTYTVRAYYGYTTSYFNSGVSCYSKY